MERENKEGKREGNKIQKLGGKPLWLLCLAFHIDHQITCLLVRWWNIDDVVKPAGSEQCTVQTVWSVRGSYDHHVFVANLLTVQLLIKRGLKKAVS